MILFIPIYFFFFFFLMIRRPPRSTLFPTRRSSDLRVVEVGDYSVELCGGTHVVRTSQVGAVKILGEGSIGSNLRRVEALTGAEAIADFRKSRVVLEHVA